MADKLECLADRLEGMTQNMEGTAVKMEGREDNKWYGYRTGWRVSRTKTEVVLG